MTDTEKVSRMSELYKSLSDDGKDSFVQNLLDDEDLMGRLLGTLLEINEENQGEFNGDSNFISFLRKVKE